MRLCQITWIGLHSRRLSSSNMITLRGSHMTGKLPVAPHRIPVTRHSSHPPLYHGRVLHMQFRSHCLNTDMIDSNGLPAPLLVAHHERPKLLDPQDLFPGPQIVVSQLNHPSASTSFSLAPRDLLPLKDNQDPS